MQGGVGVGSSIGTIDDVILYNLIGAFEGFSSYGIDTV